VAVNVDDAPRTARLDLSASAETRRLNPLFGAPRIEGVDNAGLTLALGARRGAILDVRA